MENNKIIEKLEGSKKASDGTIISRIKMPEYILGLDTELRNLTYSIPQFAFALKDFLYYDSELNIQPKEFLYCVADLGIPIKEFLYTVAELDIAIKEFLYRYPQLSGVGNQCIIKNSLINTKL